MKKIFVFTAVFLSLALSTAPAFARTSLIGTHGRHGRTEHVSGGWVAARASSPEQFQHFTPGLIRGLVRQE